MWCSVVLNATGSFRQVVEFTGQLFQLADSYCRMEVPVARFPQVTQWDRAPRPTPPMTDIGDPRPGTAALLAAAP
jgi:hypothetical protein